MFVGLNGAAAIRQVDLQAGTAGVQVSLGGCSYTVVPPFTAKALAALPGQPHSVAVLRSDGGVVVYDNGTARSKQDLGNSIYQNDGGGAFAFGGSASTLFYTSGSINSYLYRLTVGDEGVTGDTHLTVGNFGNTLQFDNGRLYPSSGLVFDAASGTQLGQFSFIPSYSGNPAASAGPIVSESALNRAWIIPFDTSSPGRLLAFDEKTFNPVDSLALTGVGQGPIFDGSAADLIRWGQNGLAFRTAMQVYILEGSLVKDNSDTPADLSVSVQAPSTASTGTATSVTYQVTNLGPNQADGVTMTITLPSSVVLGSVHAGAGTCSGSATVYCDLGSIAGGVSVPVTASLTPTAAATLQTRADLTSASFDPNLSDNQANAAIQVTGSLFSAPPTLTQLSPSLTQAGAKTLTLTVNGVGFSPASTVMWNGTALPTTLNNSGQLAATVDASLVKNMGWAQVSVVSAAPGGGQSSALPFSIYNLLDIPANAIAYDPFTQKLYAALPSTSATLTGNSIVAIDPATGSYGNPIQVGSEPNRLSETSDGNYLFVGLSGAKSLGRFNLLSQSLDMTVPILVGSIFGNVFGPVGAIAAQDIATIPGSDASLVIDTGTTNGAGVFDISGSAGSFRPKYTGVYNGSHPVVVDPTHFSAEDSSFGRFSIDSTGAHAVDQTTLNGLPGFSKLAVDGGLVYGALGGIINPQTAPPSQVALLPRSTGLYGSDLSGGGIVPDAAQGKAFQIGLNQAGTAQTFLGRYDTQHSVLEQQIQLPTDAAADTLGTRWGQDGLAYLLPSATFHGPSQIFLIRGPFVLPSELMNNPAPALSGTDHDTVASGSGNTYITVAGSGFLPGAVVLWGGAPHETTFLDSAHLRVAVAEADIAKAATVTLSGSNPGSGNSNSITVRVQ